MGQGKFARTTKSARSTAPARTTHQSTSVCSRRCADAARAFHGGAAINFQEGGAVVTVVLVGEGMRGCLGMPWDGGGCAAVAGVMAKEEGCVSHADDGEGGFRAGDI